MSLQSIHRAASRPARPSARRRRRPLPAIAALLAAVSLVGPATAGNAVSDGGGFYFVDIAGRAGLDFVHQRGAFGDKDLPETMGAGVGWLDYDLDGRQDLYLVQSGVLPGTAHFDADARPGNVLYRNLGNLTFRPAPAGADDRGYGMGVTVADYDNDGWPDVFVTNYGANRLYRNNGDGTFSAQTLGLEDERWSASAAWGDLDADGDADLFVTNYVVYDPADAVRCGEQLNAARSYCHIDLFDGLPDLLYRNEGDGTFTELAAQAGVANAREGKGLGVVMADFDDDGLTDVYVANDTQQNFLYINRGDWRFEDEGLFSGTGYSEDGDAQAGMGTDAVDLDGDGVEEILVTNFAFEPNNLYRQIAPGIYLDQTFVLGFGEPGLAMLAFGVAAFDADADGDLEIAVANGHILDNVDAVQDSTTYPQPNHLFRNLLAEHRRALVTDGELSPGQLLSWRPERELFEEVSATSGPGFGLVEVSRGLAVGDADGDGLAEIAVMTSGGPVHLLHNRSEGGKRLALRLRGRRSSRDALGAKVTLVPLGGDPADGATGLPQVREVRTSSSYCSQNAGDLLFGLGTSPRAEIRVRWPDGTEQRFLAEAGATSLLVQGRDQVAATRPLAPRR